MKVKMSCAIDSGLATLYSMRETDIVETHRGFPGLEWEETLGEFK